MARRRRLAPLWVLLSVLLGRRDAAALASSSPSKCDPQCQFTVPPSDEPACRVYGAGSSSSAATVPFYRANATCLAALNVSMAGISLERLLAACPNKEDGATTTTDGAADEATGLANLIMDGSDEASMVEADYVMSQYPDYFEISNSTGRYQLRPFVSDRLGQQVDCIQAPLLCWNELKIYLSTDPGGLESMAATCAGLRDRFRARSAREQSEARRALCLRGASSSSSSEASEALSSDAALPACEPLAQQVAEAAGGSAGCDAAAAPADPGQIPADCEPAANASGGGGTSGGSGGRGSRGGELVLAFVLGLWAIIPISVP
jgi:hypothetical protein